jgi:hypothetical protein
MIKKLSECIKISPEGTEGICVLDVPQGAIKSVIFGYQYDLSNMKMGAEQLLKFDSSVLLQRVIANDRNGALELEPVALA